MFERKRLSLLCIALCSAASFGQTQNSGSINVKYAVLAVMYAPPGTNAQTNYARYDVSSLVGTSVDLSGSFQSSVTYAVGSNLAANSPITPAGTGAIGTPTFTNQRDTTTAVSFNKIAGQPLEVDAAATAGVDHAQDVILVWLNPVANFAATGNGSQTSGVTCNGFSYDTADANVTGMDLIRLTVAQLRNPGLIDGGTLQRLQRGWDPSGLGALNATDYATILARDPLAVGGTNIDPARFEQFTSVPYQWGMFFNGQFGAYGSTSYQGTQASDIFQVAYAPRSSNSSAFNSAFSAVVKNGAQLTWRNQYSQTRSQTTLASGAASTEGPSGTESFPGGNPNLVSSDYLTVLKDNIFGTFLFASNQSSSSFVPITPCRAVDTRLAAGPLGGPMLSGGTTRNFNISGTCGIPQWSVNTYVPTGYALNVTVVPKHGLGYLTVWPTDERMPLGSLMNSDGRIKANAALVMAGTNGAISVYASDDTDVIIDVNAYMRLAGVVPGGMAFYSVPRCRAFDTRTIGSKVVSGETAGIGIQTSGCGIPDGAAAYSLNITAIPQTGLGYLTVWPSGQAKPLVSTLNSFTGATTANAAIVQAGTSGNISIFVTDTADVVVDINGYFSANGGSNALYYSYVPAFRALDTRNSGMPVDGSLTSALNSESPFMLYRDIQGFAVNVTAIPEEPLGFMSLLTPGAAPTTSTLNAWDQAITSNLAIVPTTTNGVTVYTPQERSHVILDVTGYFVP